MKNFAGILLLLVLMFSSCTIEKMRYSRGYHIEWIGKKNHSVSAHKAKYQKKETQPYYVQASEHKQAVVPEITETRVEKPTTETAKAKHVEKPAPANIKKKVTMAQPKSKENQIASEKTYTDGPQNFTQKSAVQKKEKTQLVGFALLLVGLLLALLGLVFFAVLGVFFGPIFLVIFLLGAAICILAGLLSALF